LGFKSKAAERQYNRQYYAKNREKLNARACAWGKQNRHRQRAYQLKYRYGLSPESWAALFAAQGQECAICKVGSARWHTDHNHATGKVRGILCNACNMGIGLLKDDVTVLRAKR
jgi:hypothetical protein